jgi:hypothetical protein
MSADNDLWYVKTADGDVNRVTLDQLDEAFNAGQIDENVMVLGSGQTKWARLGELLGLDEPAAAPAPSSAPMAPRANFVPIPVPLSMRPVSIDLSDDIGAAPFRKKSRPGVVIGALVGALAIGGIVFAASHANRGSGDTAAAAAVPAPPPVTPPAEPTPPPAPSPVAVTPPPSSDRFSDDQKARLKAADEERADKAKARKNARSVAAPHSHKYKSQGFTSGGNKYDPLNSSL